MLLHRSTGLEGGRGQDGHLVSVFWHVLAATDSPTWDQSFVVAATESHMIAVDSGDGRTGS